jgi:hypothetical protein
MHRLKNIVRVHLQQICESERSKRWNLKRESQHPFRAFQAAAMLQLLTSAYTPAASPTHLLSKAGTLCFCGDAGVVIAETDGKDLINVR